MAAEQHAARQAAVEGKLVLPIEPSDHGANPEKLDFAVAEEPTNETNTDDLPDYESDMDYCDATDNIQQEGVAGKENRGDVLDHESDKENTNQCEHNAFDPKSPDATPASASVPETPPSHTGHTQSTAGLADIPSNMNPGSSISVAFFKNIFIKKLVIEEAMFGGVIIADAVVVAKDDDTVIEKAVVHEAFVKRAFITPHTVVFEGGVFRHVAIDKLVCGNVVFQQGFIPAVSIGTAVMTIWKEQSSGADSAYQSPNSGESPDTRPPSESSSSSPSSPSSPAKRKATQTEELMTPSKKRSCMPRSSPNGRA
ncbi:hypothetical protein F4820DRAFT_263130 [Hypoxylon rubiginosum]|uniref:Uncharacterized protein n=1 Tax=Hypoxylon rubiginosum TaxID=110542 RepID=A0ACB9Z440_9PEZI|nr:hypothetical protein F4820DRAFT_263130 [Hypoxylon rubiginosum]